MYISQSKCEWKFIFCMSQLTDCILLSQFYIFLHHTQRRRNGFFNFLDFERKENANTHTPSKWIRKKKISSNRRISWEAHRREKLIKIKFNVIAFNSVKFQNKHEHWCRVYIKFVCCLLFNCVYKSSTVSRRWKRTQQSSRREKGRKKVFFFHSLLIYACYFSIRLNRCCWSEIFFSLPA